MKNMKKLSILAELRAGISGAGTAVVSALVVFLSRAEWRYFLEKIPLQYLNLPLAFILMPLALATDYAKAGLAAYDLHKAIQSRNNIGRQAAHFAVELIKATLITITILSILGAFTLPPLIGPIIFITGIGLGAAFNGYAFIDKAVQWSNALTSDDSNEKKAATLKSALVFGVSTVLTVGFAIMLLSGIGAGVLLGIGLTTAGIFLAGGIAAAIINYQSEKKAASLAMQTEMKSGKNSYSESLTELLLPEKHTKEALTENLAENNPALAAPARSFFGSFFCSSEATDDERYQADNAAAFSPS